ncbi:MAG: thioredoxin [Bacteroidetes bacterium]|nr:MAG: thioredoxin [Bacteroidota bacterium]
MLYTNLKHIETAKELKNAVAENENVMIVCGRMGPFSIPVYRIAEELEPLYKQVKFFDMEFDNPESAVIRNLPEVQHLSGFPLTVYFKNGEVVNATSGIQTKEQVINILEHEFTETINA